MTGLQLRYVTGLTSEEYVKSEAWRDARLERWWTAPTGSGSRSSARSGARRPRAASAGPRADSEPFGTAGAG